MSDICYWGWSDPDKKKTVEQKLAEGAEEYTRAWGHAPHSCLMNEDEARSLAGTPGLDLYVQVGPVPRHAFYFSSTTPEGDA